MTKVVSRWRSLKSASHRRTRGAYTWAIFFRFPRQKAARDAGRQGRPVQNDESREPLAQAEVGLPPPHQGLVHLGDLFSLPPVEAAGHANDGPRRHRLAAFRAVRLLAPRDEVRL